MSNMRNMQKVLTDADITAMSLRNQEKVSKAVKQMGVQYACHPANVIRRNPARSNFAPVRGIGQ